MYSLLIKNPVDSNEISIGRTETLKGKVQNW